MSAYVDFLNRASLDFNDQIFFGIGHSEDARDLPANSMLESSYARRRWAFLDMLRLMYRADKIILHGLWDDWLNRLLALQPWLLRKCYWLIWGADLYRYQFANRTFNWWLKEIPRWIVIRNIGHLVTYIDGDVRLARQWYGAQGKHHECLIYPSNVYKDRLAEPHSKERLNIQLGNSASATNEHVEMLERLRGFQDDDIRIYAPLSYGDDAYAAEVTAAGHEFFGDKFVALTKFLSPDEYSEFLSKIDIAIFNHRRQEGMGNIISLLGMGKKVYLREGVTSQLFFEKIGVRVFGTNSISLNRLDTTTAKQNVATVKEYFSEPALAAQWKSILD